MLEIQTPPIINCILASIVETAVAFAIIYLWAKLTNRL